ncbi:T9SS type A sorting domain-containing protein [Flavobacterium sp.]|uniref:DUF7619 domain-containing protein n=1 Tax=Flavobacterium sp. TaxID=239 RepID=UPI00286A7334|nr:T9SS type A sorting domain-containing protein [Flavobacterium sp.]
MKNTLLLLLLFTGIVNGQVVTIPDANFKTKLIALGVDTNLDGQIQNSEAAIMTVLNVSFQNISDLTGIEAFTNLTYLDCTQNNLTTLDLSMLSQINTLYCPNNQLSTLNVNGCHLLDKAIVTSNNFISLDFSNSNVREFNCENNPNLEYVNIKNGILSQGVGIDPPVLSFTNTPNLKFVCVDEIEAQLVTECGVNPNLVAISTYCSFVPGGNFNTITGTIKFDNENDGCDVGDLVQPYTKVKISDGTNTGSFYTNSDGNYSFFTQAGSFTITPEVQNPTYFTITPASQIVTFPIVDNSTQIQDFCIVANGVHPDLEIILVPIGGATPGADSDYKLVYKNKGNQVQSGSINLSFDDSRSDFVSATPAVANQGFNSLLWFYSSLQPFETREIKFKLNINSTVETPAVNVGDILSFTANINFSEGDETPLDNFFNLSQLVVNTLDLNSKICLQGTVLTTAQIGDYLHYNINFENTGTTDATNIVVEDIIDPTKFDISTLQVLYGSDTLETKITNDKVEFIFKDINLPRAIINPIGGHGNVLFKIKTLPTLVGGDIVTNTGTIYFDYNVPTQTNEARTDVVLSNASFTKDESITVAPNPTKNNIVITSKNNIKSIMLFDEQGRQLQTVFDNRKSTVLDLSNKVKGIYFLKVTSEMGSNVEKIVKE